MAVSMIGPKFYAWDRDGKPLAFGKLYTYQARTNTPKDTYQSEDQQVANTNPVILNGEGYANVYLDGSYKMVLKDSDDNEIWTSDPVSAVVSTEWVNCVPASYVSPASFAINGNFTAEYLAGRRVRVDNAAPEYTYSTIASSSYAGGVTTVVLGDPIVTTGIVGTCTSLITPDSSPDNTILTFDDVSAALASLLYEAGDVINIRVPYDGRVGSDLWDVYPVGAFAPRNDDVLECTGNIDLIIKRRNPSGNESFQGPEQLTKYTMSPNRHVFGEEYLWGFHKQVFDSNNTNSNKFVWSGDSTTAGDNAGGYTPNFIATLVCGDLGLARYEHINAGHSGQSSVGWNNTYVSQDIANHPDMNVYVTRWGINDGSEHGNVNTYITNMDQALGKLRAFKSVKDLAIVVVAPSSTYDDPNNRGSNWYEQIVPELRKLCRKHAAVFFDTYSIWQDARQGALAGDPRWLDDPFGDGRGIHPDATFACQIGLRITEMIVKPALVKQNIKGNAFLNVDPASFMPSAGTSPSSWPNGIATYTVRLSDSWPTNGKLVSRRNGTKVIHELYSTEDDSVSESTSVISTRKLVRFGDADGGDWSKWFNIGVTPTVGGGWSVSSGRPPKYVHHENGSCVLMGTVDGGTDGTTIFTLPEEMRPSVPRTFPVIGSSGIVGSILILNTGEVQPYMNGGTFVNFDGVCWRAGD